MRWLKHMMALTVSVSAIVACSKKDKVTTPVVIQPALLDTIFCSTYEGIIPCPDCPGIETNIRIYNDSTISRTIYYQNRNELPITKIGTWKLKDSIFEATFDREKLFYKIKNNNKILRVGSDLKEVTGDLAANYTLYKSTPLKGKEIEANYIIGDSTSYFSKIEIKHKNKDRFEVKFTSSNKLDSLKNCTTKLEAHLDKAQQLNMALNNKKGNLKIIFTKKEAHVLFENISKDSAYLKCKDSLILDKIEGSYKKI